MTRDVWCSISVLLFAAVLVGCFFVFFYECAFYDCAALEIFRKEEVINSPYVLHKHINVNIRI